MDMPVGFRYRQGVEMLILYVRNIPLVVSGRGLWQLLGSNEQGSLHVCHSGALWLFCTRNLATRPLRMQTIAYFRVFPVTLMLI